MNEDEVARTGAPTSSEEVATVLHQLSADITSVKSDMDQIIQPLVEALNRNKYFDQFQERLRTAERVNQAWRDWPLIIGIHEAVITLRSDPDPNKHILEHLQSLLFQADVTEYGLEGAEILPEEVETLASSGNGPIFTVAVCHRPGLKVGSLPLRKAIVEIVRTERTAS